MEPEKRINYKKKPIKKYQRIWNYIRRNRGFKYSDIKIIIEVDDVYLGSYINALVKAEYLKVVKKSGYKAQREYRLVKLTGTLAPIYTPKEKKLYDQNTKQYVHFSRENKRINPQFDSLKNMLEYMITDEKKILLRKELEDSIDNTFEPVATKWITRLQTAGVIWKKKATESYKNAKRWKRNYVKVDGVFIYEVDLVLAKKLYQCLLDSEYKTIRSYWSDDNA